MRLSWLGHSSFLIEMKDGRVIYIDPYKVHDGKAADIILLTHPHFDHASKDDISALSRDGTEIIGPADCAGITKSVSPGKKIMLAGITIEAVPAYNIKKDYHPMQNNWVGYVIEIDGKRIYHAGDTDLIPEMRELTGIDTALLPVRGTYTMDAEEAARAAEIIKPRVAIPMHYGKVVGSEGDALTFKRLYKGEVQILGLP
jgi:L-ascorbate metabolism protein UlaG (beta-lactamase superfamily)